MTETKQTPGATQHSTDNRCKKTKIPNAKAWNTSCGQILFASNASNTFSPDLLWPAGEGEDQGEGVGVW